MLCQKGIGAQMRGNLEWVGIDVEHAAHAIDDHEKPSGIFKMNAEGNRIASLLKRSFDAAFRSVQGDRSAITTLLDHLDARRSAGREKPQHPIPVIRRAEAEPKNVFIFRLRLGARDKSADVSRSPAIHRADRSVEAANASEAGGVRNLLHGQRRFVDELLDEMQPAGLRNRVGRGAKMLHEQATKVTGSDTQAAGKGVHTVIFEPAFTDQPQGARNRRRRAHPRGRARRVLRAAPEAWTKARFRGGGSAFKVAHVLFLGGGRRTNRTTINSCGQNSDEDASIKTRIAGPTSLGTRSVIQRHVGPFKIAEVLRESWTFSDVNVGCAAQSVKLPHQRRRRNG